MHVRHPEFRRVIAVGPRLRTHVYELLEDDESRTATRYWIDIALIVLIVVSVGGDIIGSVAELEARWGPVLEVIEIITVLIFTVEYALRLWICVDDRAGRYEHPVFGRLRYAATPLALIDLLAILPFYLSLFFAQDLVFLRVFRLLRILKLARYSPALAVFEVVLLNQGRALIAAVTIVTVLMLVAAGLIHTAERATQPEDFGSIPAAIWWAAVTMSTVGYGDVVPVTPMGKLLAAVVSLLGIGMFALPTAILGAGFMQELQKHDFATTTRMVARVPIFASLAPAQLAEIAALLTQRDLPPRYTIMRAGEHPDAMYFIVEGKVVYREGKNRSIIAAGGFFGERALVEGGERKGTIVTLGSCRLLELRSSDFQKFIGSDPTLEEAIMQQVRRYASCEAPDAGEDQENR